MVFSTATASKNQEATQPPPRSHRRVQSRAPSRPTFLAAPTTSRPPPPTPPPSPHPRTKPSCTAAKDPSTRPCHTARNFTAKAPPPLLRRRPRQTPPSSTPKVSRHNTDRSYKAKAPCTQHLHPMLPNSTAKAPHPHTGLNSKARAQCTQHPRQTPQSSTARAPRLQTDPSSKARAPCTQHNHNTIPSCKAREHSSTTPTPTGRNWRDSTAIRCSSIPNINIRRILAVLLPSRHISRIQCITRALLLLLRLVVAMSCMGSSQDRRRRRSSSSSSSSTGRGRLGGRCPCFMRWRGRIMRGDGGGDGRGWVHLVKYGDWTH